MAKTKIHAEVIADSLNTATGDRLMTFKGVFPWTALPQLLTHRALSRNGASTRAVPGRKMRMRVLLDPAAPIYWGKNQPGMQASEPLTRWELWGAKRLHYLERYPALLSHWIKDSVFHAHKEVINKNLMTWLWMEMVISATELNNFFALRDHGDAQSEIARLARCMKEAREGSTPAMLKPGEWHLPFVEKDDEIAICNTATGFDVAMNQLKSISAARCARVSYYLRDGQRSPLEKDLELCLGLAGSNPKHLSPFEHVAQALPTRERCGNFVGWKQFRKEFEDESNGDYQE